MRRLLTSSVLLALVFGLVPSVAMANSYNSTATATWIPNGQVWAMAVTSTRIYLGGDFTSLKNPATGATVTRNHLVAIDRSTGNPSSTWNPSIVDNAAELDQNGFRTNPAVGALALGPGGTVFVGGDFSTIGGKDRDFVAAVDADGEVLDSWDPTVNGRVWDFSVSGTDLYMVGQFGDVSGSDRDGAALLSTVDAAVDPAWDPQLTGGRAQSIAQSEDTIFLGGTFTGLGNAPNRSQKYLASVDATSGEDTGWAPPSQCENLASECRVRDLAVDGSRVFAAVGGEPGGRAVAWSLDDLTGTPLWKNDTDGEVQAVTVYDGVAYFGGHFGTRVQEMNLGVTPPTIRQTHGRNQFFAANPATGDVLAYQLPTILPATPGIRVIQADSKALRVGGQTQINGKPYKNFLTFAHPGVSIAGPVAITKMTKVTVKTKGCKTCKVRLTENRGSGAAWSSSWVKGKKGTTHFTVPTSRTHGLTVQIDAPWEKRQTKTAEVVMRYKGQGVGDKVSAKEAQKCKKATSCYAGTSASDLTFSVKVKKSKKGAKVAARAWTVKTQKFDNPLRKSPKGVLSTQKATKCS